MTNFKIFKLLIAAFLISANSNAQTFQLPYFNDFDSSSVGWTSTPSILGNTAWQLGSPNFGTTNSAFTSPNSWDVNLDSAYEANAECYLTSPFFDFSSSPITELKFWQDRNVQNNWDGTHLEYSLDSGFTWQVLGAVGSGGSVNWYNNPSLIASGLPGWTGQSGGQIGNSIWQQSSIPLPDFSTNPSPVQFRFVFNSNSSVQFDGMNIDNFQIDVTGNVDIGLLNINYTNPSPAGDTIPLLVQFANYGSAPQDSIQICYNINGGNTTCVIWVFTLLPGDTIQPFWIGNVIVPQGASSICVWTIVANDNNPNNDILCGPLTGENVIPLSFGNDFCDYFDGINNGWTKEIFNNQWELGMPAATAINTAHSTPNVWMINLTGNYNNNSNDNLISPPFDFSNAINAKLSFYNWIHSEANWDGGRIDYSTDNGANWQTLGTTNDPKGVNWYNNSNLISTQKPGWEGLSFGWVKSEYLLSQFNNYPDPIKFRFNFSSDGAVNSFNGWAIDDFKLEIPITVNASTNTISAGGPIVLPGLKAISTIIKNGGSIDLTTVNITLEIDGNIIVTDTRSFSSPLPFNATINHTFSLPWNAVSGCSDIRVWTSDPNLSIDMNLSDDTTSTEFCVFETINTFPYCNNFETGNKWTTYNSKNNSAYQSWELGTPAQPNINMAFSGNNAWMTNLNQNYVNEDASVLLTPGFNVVLNNCYRFSFEGNFITEKILDGGSIDFSYDNGVTWIPFGDTSNSNWYNTYNIFSFGTLFAKPGWSDNSNGWQHYEKFHNGQSSGTVIFRFWFVSDLTITNEGWAIDDFCFEEFPPNCITSVDDEQSISLQNVYPNPASDFVQISFELLEAREIEIKIVDLLGKSILNIENKKYHSGEHLLRLETKELKAGIYFIRFKTGKLSNNKKLVIVK